MQKRDFPGLGETLYSAVLPNGLPLFVVPKPDFQSCYAALAVNYGGAHRRFRLEENVTDTPAGVAHYLEHKMFDMPEGDNALNRLSANGADPNAFTSADMTCYYFQCTEKFEENLRLLLLHFVTTPYFTEETVNKERGIIEQEIRMGEDSPDTAIYYALLRQLFAAHPVRDQVAGTVESIGEITAETLHACHRVFYAPSNLCLCVEGDVDPERIEALARELLPEDRAPLPTADFGPEEGPEPVEKRREAVMPVSAPRFLAGTKLPAGKGEEAQRGELTARLALRLLMGPSSRFYTSLYAEGLLNRDFGYGADYAAGVGMMMFGGESRDPERVLKAFEETAAEVCEKGFEPAAFERARRAAYGAQLRGLEDFENVCIAQLRPVGGAARPLEGGGLEDFENVCIALAVGRFEGYCALEAPELLARITKEECERFVRENLRPERLALSVVTAGKDA